MKLATVIISFNDLKEGVFRKAGDTFTCDDQRAKELEALGLVWLKDAPAEKPKSKTRKKQK